MDAQGFFDMAFGVEPEKQKPAPTVTKGDWTTEPPTKRGYYWFKYDDVAPPEVVWVTPAMKDDADDAPLLFIKFTGYEAPLWRVLNNMSGLQWSLIPTPDNGTR